MVLTMAVVGKLDDSSCFLFFFPFCRGVASSLGFLQSAMFFPLCGNFVEALCSAFLPFLLCVPLQLCSPLLPFLLLLSTVLLSTRKIVVAGGDGLVLLLLTVEARVAGAFSSMVLLRLGRR